MTLTGFYQGNTTQGGFLFGESGKTFFKAQVCETGQSDLCLIYHHLQSGKPIELVQFVKDGRVMVGVFFKGFRIGTLSETVSRVFLANISRGRKISAFIRSIDRKKFLPPTQVEIEVVVE